MSNTISRVIGTTSDHRNDYTVRVEFEEQNGKFILTGSSLHGREILQYKGKAFNSEEELIKFAKAHLKNILD